MDFIHFKFTDILYVYAKTNNQRTCVAGFHRTKKKRFLVLSNIDSLIDDFILKGHSLDDKEVENQAGDGAKKKTYTIRLRVIDR